MLVRDTFQHVIGQIDKGVFFKRISGSKHFLREPEPAIAIDAFAYDSIIARHTDSLTVLDRETKDTYSIPTTEFNQHRQELERGHGRQYFVPLRLWRLQKSPQGRLL